MVQPKNILVVEDDKLLASIFKMYIQNLGHNLVGVSSSANDSIEKCKTLAPDLVLMDINLSGEQDGIYATQQIQATTDVPVVFVTGETSEMTLERALTTNTYGYLVKPITKEPLQENIQFAIEKHHQNKQLKLGDRRLLTWLTKSATPALIVSNEDVRVINPAAFRFFKAPHFYQIVDQPVAVLIDKRYREVFFERLHLAYRLDEPFGEMQLNCTDFNHGVIPVRLIGSNLVFDNQKSVQLVIKKL